MTLLKDGRIKCDSCGAIDESVDIHLSDGWTRKDIQPAPNSLNKLPIHRHFCPNCSDNSTKEKQKYQYMTKEKPICGCGARAKQFGISKDGQRIWSCSICNRSWVE